MSRSRSLYRRALRRFLRAQDGSMSVEAVIVLPILFSVLLLCVVFFDAYRTINTNAKAAYAVADLISRQVAPVNEAYLDGLGEVYGVLAGTRHPTRLRVSSIDMDPNTAMLRIRWTHGTGGLEGLTPEVLQLMAHRVPTLSVGETVLLVETLLDYTPLSSSVMSEQTLSHVIPTRPRFVPRVVFESPVS